jgi:hypothetical protein
VRRRYWRLAWLACYIILRNRQKFSHDIVIVQRIMQPMRIIIARGKHMHIRALPRPVTRKRTSARCTCHSKGREIGRH